MKGMDAKPGKARLGKWGWVGIALGVLSLVPWVLDMFGVSTSGILAPYLPTAIDVFKTLSPIGMFAGGMLVGWHLHGMRGENERLEADAQAERERLSAENDARIERENREHEEKMRIGREEREAAKSAEADRLALEKKMNAAAVEFKKYEVDTKAVVCRIYDEGEFVFGHDMNEGRDDCSIQISRLTECETLPYNEFRYTLKPFTKDMLDAHPELLKDVREYLEQNRER